LYPGLSKLPQIDFFIYFQRHPSSASNYYLHDPPCCQCSVPSPNNIWALMTKNFTKLRRTPSNLAFIFLLPAIQVTFFCVAIGREPTSLPMAVVNEEISGTNNTNCSWPTGCEFDFLSCRFFDSVFGGGGGGGGNDSSREGIHQYLKGSI
jgi:hypothetical protein